MELWGYPLLRGLECIESMEIWSGHSDLSVTSRLSAVEGSVKWDCIVLHHYNHMSTPPGSPLRAFYLVHLHVHS
jgi:hypothetical protein